MCLVSTQLRYDICTQQSTWTRLYSVHRALILSAVWSSGDGDGDDDDDDDRQVGLVNEAILTERAATCAYALPQAAGERTQPRPTTFCTHYTSPITNLL